MTEYDSIVDNFGVYTYKSPLIYFRCENFTNWKHRELTVKEDPFANAYICKLDEEIFADLPIFEPDIFEMDNIHEEWLEEGWTDLNKNV